MTSFLLPKVFNTSLAEPAPAGYEDVADVVPPYSAYSAKGRPEVGAGGAATAKRNVAKIHSVTSWRANLSRETWCT